MEEYTEAGATDYRVLHPRPAYLIVTRKPNGGLNVMAASWVTPVSEEPFNVALSIDREAYTCELLEASGEATINVVGEEMASIVWRAGSTSGREVDKWNLLDLEPLEPKIIGTPGVRGAYAVLECVLKNKIDVGECRLFIMEVKSVRVRRDLYTRYGWDYRRARILLHSSGRAFVTPGKLVIVKQ